VSAVFNTGVIPSKGLNPLSERPLDQLTLRELFTETEMVVRELVEHLEQSFHPQLRSLDELIRIRKTPRDRSQTSDSSVRNQVAAVLESDDFSQKLLHRLDGCLAAIREGAHRALNE
jgi:hypothetical protein